MNPVPIFRHSSRHSCHSFLARKTIAAKAFPLTTQHREPGVFESWIIELAKHLPVAVIARMVGEHAENYTNKKNICFFCLPISNSEEPFDVFERYKHKHASSQKVYKFVVKYAVLCYSYKKERRDIMNIAMPLNHTVPITAFNRGKAGQIFSSVKQSGMTVVMKNNEAECVLLSPQRYNDLIERIENAELLAVAHERLRNFDPETSSTVSFEEICAKEKINLSTSVDDVEIL